MVWAFSRDFLLRYRSLIDRHRPGPNTSMMHKILQAEKVVDALKRRVRKLYVEQSKIFRREARYIRQRDMYLKRAKESIKPRTWNPELPLCAYLGSTGAGTSIHRGWTLDSI